MTPSVTLSTQMALKTNTLPRYPSAYLTRQMSFLSAINHSALEGNALTNELLYQVQNLHFRYVL